MYLTGKQHKAVVAAAFWILLVVAGVIRGQEARTNPTLNQAQKEKETEQRQELQKKAVALLNDVASAAWALKLPENRAFVMTNVADLFWTIDEKRARTVYWDALNALNLPATARTANENLSKAERDKLVQTYLSTFALRQRLLRLVAQKDADLALEMLRATRQVPPRSDLPLLNDSQLEREIAYEVAMRDPERALQLARESLAKGFSYELLNLLFQLNQKNSEKGLQLAGEIIAKLQTTNVATDLHAPIVAVQLLENSRPPQDEARLVMFVGTNAAPSHLNLSDEQRRELAEILTDAVLSTSANSNLLFEIAQVMPEIEQFFPDRRAPIERKVTAFKQTLSKGQQEWNTYNNLIRHGTPEEVMRAAATANDLDTRLMLYRQAALIALSRGTTDSFRDLLSKEVTDKSQQQAVLEFLEDEEIRVAAGRKQIDQLQKLLPKIRRKEQRAFAMAELALMLKEKGEDAEAASLLDEAATLIKTDLKSEEQTNALLTLLCAYAIVDPPKAFVLAERTVDQANSQIALLLLVDHVIKSGAVKKSEIVLDQASILPLDYLVLKYGKGVATLARTDFNRTRALADRFERNELRLMARLMILRGILRP